MFLGTRREVDRTLRLSRRRTDLRIMAAGLLVVGLLTASTVVSADALRQLPGIWETIKARPGDASARTQSDVRALEARELAGPNKIDDPDDAHPVEPNFPVSTHSTAKSSNLPSSATRRIHLDPADYAESWFQAADDPDQREAVKRSHQVVVGLNGALQGRIVTHGDAGTPNPLKSTRVFLTHQGALTATALTDADGRFSVTGLTTGTHALIVAGNNTLLASGFHVLRSDEQAGIDDSIDFALETAAVTGDDVPAALRRVPSRPQGAASNLSEIEPEDGLIPAGVRDVRQTGVPGTSIQKHTVRLNADGQLLGRAHRMHPKSGRPLLPPPTEIVLMQQGEVVGTARTDEQGLFAFPGVEPGVYALVASTIDEPLDHERMADNRDETQPVAMKRERADQSGFAAFAVEVISPLSLVHAEMTDHRVMHAAGDVPLTLSFALMDAADLLGFTGLYSSASEQASKGSAARTTIPPSGTKTATSSARAATQSPTSVINNAAGGGGGNASFPFLPLDDDGTMSPRAL